MVIVKGDDYKSLDKCFYYYEHEPPSQFTLRILLFSVRPTLPPTPSVVGLIKICTRKAYSESCLVLLNLAWSLDI